MRKIIGRITEREAIELLRKYSGSKKDFKEVLAHSKAVQKLAVDIGKKAQKRRKLELDFIKTASLLHDIGRFRYGPESKEQVKHGIAGGEILRKEGLPDYAMVAERHLGAGISKEDILERGLALPLKDYIPVSTEEKIIAHADNLVFGSRIGTVEEAVEGFKKKLGKKAGRKIKELAEEVEGFG